MVYTPYSSLFDSYPTLLRSSSTMPPPGIPIPKVPSKLTPAQCEQFLAIGKAVRATKYDDRNEQRIFLDEKVEIVVCVLNSLCSMV